MGKEEDQGGFNDLYDMDDDFIDDDELQDYYGGDRRKTKYSGFFINKASVATGPSCHTFLMHPVPNHKNQLLLSCGLQAPSCCSQCPVSLLSRLRR